MKTQPKAKPDRPRRDRSNWIVADLGPLRGILEAIARQDADDTGEPMNLTRTLRQLVRTEAERRGIRKTQL